MKRRWIAAVILLLAAAGAFCGERYYTTAYLPAKQLDEAAEKQAVIIDKIRPEPDTENKRENQEKTTNENQSDPLAPCGEINDDIVGWITIPDTQIDLPIVQGEDNDFYLHNGVDGQYNAELGCPFLDYRCDAGFQGLNSIVYAHHMDRQRMFADIARYSEAGFLETHNTGTLTLHDGVHPVKFFAYLSTYSTSPAYHTVFVSRQEECEYIGWLYEAARYTDRLTEEELVSQEALHLLLLSTCTFETDDARGILVGVIL